MTKRSSDKPHSRNLPAGRCTSGGESLDLSRVPGADHLACRVDAVLVVAEDDHGVVVHVRAEGPLGRRFREALQIVGDGRRGEPGEDGDAEEGHRHRDPNAAAEEERQHEEREPPRRRVGDEREELGGGEEQGEGS